MLIFSLILSCVSTGLGMVQPYFAKIIIDKVFVNQNSEILFTILSALIALLIVSFGIRVINSYIYTRYSAKILFSMREDLFAHLQKIPMGFFAKKKIGDIYSRIASDMADIQSMVTDTIPRFIFDFLTCVLAGGILIWLNWKMALMCFAFLPIAVMIIQKLRPRFYALSEDVAKSNADIAHFLFEALSNISLIRSFGAEKLESDKLEKKQSHILGFLLKYQILGALSSSVPTAFSILNTLVVFGYGGWLVLEGNLTIGSLVAFSIYQGRVFGPLQGLMDGVLTLQKSRVAVKRVREILDIPPVFEDRGNEILSKDQLNKEIAFNHVFFDYNRDNVPNDMPDNNQIEWVLKDISFTIPSGKTTAIAGPSGVGKTTICHLLLKLFNPHKGAITWAGKPLNILNKEWLRAKIAMVSQDTFLFHTSILENIRFANPKASLEEVVKAAQTAQIHDFIQSLPKGYETMIGDRGVSLSGGQCQRISIARAILLNPQVLILDEATAFLDTGVETLIKESIASMMKGKTTIVISHRESSIKHADKVIAFDNKGVIFEGPSEEYSHEA